MTEVSARYPVKSDTAIYAKKKINRVAFEMDKKDQYDRKLCDIEDEFKKGIVELEGSKRELTKLKSHNRDLEKQIESSEGEKNNLQTKIGTLRVKLGLANANLNTTNDEKEAIRTKLEDAQINVARLEERLSHASSELDRLRDPANPDSNMSIKKHIANDKKEIKRLKVEIESEIDNLERDNLLRQKKHEEIHTLEREVGKRQAELDTVQLELKGVQAIEEAEKQKKAELDELFGELNHEKKSYPSRLKHLKVRLGISNAGQNVSSKLADDMKLREKEMQRELVGVERKLKEATGALEILRNQHKLSKTAQSINEYTRRNQIKKGIEDLKSLAQSGPGPIKFGPKRTKDQSKVKSTSGGSTQSLSDASSRTESTKFKDNSSVNSQNVTSRVKKRETEANTLKKGTTETRGKSESIVPQPKAKMKR